MTQRVRGPISVPTEPKEWVVHDGTFRCPYLAGQTARLPLRLPSRPLSRAELSQRLEQGDRRQGYFLYRTHCPTCHACEPIRVDVPRFHPGKTQRRVLRRGDRAIETYVGRPTVSREKVALYNRHKVERGLLTGDGRIGATGYREFLVETCAETIELDYFVDRKLVGVAVADVAADALSAVYCYYDPAHGRLSLGTYSVLKMIELCRRWGMPWVYLGLYVARCRPMSYKTSFLPHERLVDGRWRRFEKEEHP
jgi:arginyl-tRNA--protein-N-Asp/Glu arginylyltransferase